MKKLITLCLLLMTLVSCKEEYVEPVHIVEEPVYNTLYLLDNYLVNDNSFYTNAFFKEDTSDWYQITNWGPRYRKYNNNRGALIVTDINNKDSCFIDTPYGIEKALKINNYKILEPGLYNISIVGIVWVGNQRTSVINDLVKYQLQCDTDYAISLINYGTIKGVNKQFCYEFNVRNIFHNHTDISLIPNYRYNDKTFKVVKSNWFTNNVLEGTIQLTKIQ